MILLVANEQRHLVIAGIVEVWKLICKGARV